MKSRQEVRKVLSPVGGCSNDEMTGGFRNFPEAIFPEYKNAVQPCPWMYVTMAQAVFHQVCQGDNFHVTWAVFWVDFPYCPATRMWILLQPRLKISFPRTLANHFWGLHFGLDLLCVCWIARKMTSIGQFPTKTGWFHLKGLISLERNLVNQLTWIR